MLNKFFMGLMLLLSGSSLAFSQVGTDPVASSETPAEASLAMASSIQGAGYANYGNETLDSLNYNGTVNLDGTSIYHNTIVNGSFEAHDARLNKLLVNGAVTVADTIVSGPVQVNGFLTCKDSTFMEQVCIASRKAVFDSSTVHDILIKPSSGNSESVVYLQDTQVLGSIVFQGGHGKVYVDKDSSIQGSVEGGEIVQN